MADIIGTLKRIAEMEQCPIGSQQEEVGTRLEVTRMAADLLRELGEGPEAARMRACWRAEHAYEVQQERWARIETAAVALLAAGGCVGDAIDRGASLIAELDRRRAAEEAAAEGRDTP